ncbi:efflux RND transporter periplasmic adaptor subunit, partial [Singulisphaera rosea]
DAASKPAAPGGEAASPEAAPPSGDPEVIVVSPVVREVASETLEFNARVDAIQTAEIRPQVGGMVTRVAFQSGRVVKKGAILFEIDSASYQAQVKIAEAELRRAASRKRVTEASLKHSEVLRKRNMMSHEDFVRAEGDLEEAQAAIDVATATLELAKLHLEQTRVTAPITGRIGRPLLTEGNITVANMTALARIIAEDPLDVICTVPTSIYRKLLPLRAKGSSGSDEDFELNVAILAPNVGVNEPIPARAHFMDFKADSSTDSLQLTAVVSNAKHALVPGMQAVVLIETGGPEKTLFIPAEACRARTSPELIQSYGKFSVFIVNEQNRLEQRPVSIDLNRRTAGEVAVSAGLTVKDRVVVSRRRNLAQGASVRPKFQASMPSR